MAQRRMFNLQIIDSDAFLEMSVSARELYFQLGMRADDDGFLGNPKRIMRMIGANEDDMRALLSKRFLLAFDNGIVVIKHWKINNYIQNDRYTATKYIEEKNGLTTKQNGAYTERIQDVSTLETQVRLGKVRLGKSNNAPPEASPFDFEDYKKTMKADKDAAIRFIAYFFEKKNLQFSSLGEVRTAIKRHLRGARDVVKFDPKKVNAAVRECQELEREKGIKWTTETLIKMMTK